MLLEFFFWWYGSGWKKAWRDCFAWVSSIQSAFSIDVLLKTLFSPWKRIVTVPGSSMDEKAHAMIDNLVSRIIGLIVRSIVLLAAVIVVMLAAVAGLLVALAWPILPFLGIGLILWGLVN